jgi:integrative and conjugative element protein (TIGR02256 family)
VGYWTYDSPATDISLDKATDNSENAVVVITHYVGPGPRAIHTKTSFTPDHEYQASRVADIYQGGQRQHVYLGDWHSHPQSAVKLSALDKRTLRRIAESVSARCPTPLMLVVDDATPPTAGLWCGMIERPVAFLRSLTRLALIELEIAFWG